MSEEAAQEPKLSWSGNNCALEAWIKPPIGKDLPIESGVIRGVAPRMVARTHVNALPQMYGQPPKL